MRGEVKECTLREIREYVEKNHYSGSVNGLKISKCYKLEIDGELGGAMIFGELSTTAWKKYGDSEKDVVELRRMVVTDHSEPNVNTWFMSRALKQLKAATAYKVVVSYADPFHGHSGIVYQASNWSYLGTTPSDVLLVTPDGKKYHSRAMRTKYKGKLKPFAERLQQMSDEGLLSKVVTPGKHVYVYALRSKQRPTNISNYPKNKNLVCIS